MSFTKEFTVAPPEDVELHVDKRDEVKFHITFPDAYCPERTYPLVFCIPGWGDSSESVYQSEKLRPYISEKYSALVVGVRYHNDLQDSSSYYLNIESIKKYYFLYEILKIAENLGKYFFRILFI